MVHQIEIVTRKLAHVQKLSDMEGLREVYTLHTHITHIYTDTHTLHTHYTYNIYMYTTYAHIYKYTNKTNRIIFMM